MRRIYIDIGNRHFQADVYTMSTLRKLSISYLQAWLFLKKLLIVYNFAPFAFVVVVFVIIIVVIVVIVVVVVVVVVVVAAAAIEYGPAMFIISQEVVYAFLATLKLHLTYFTTIASGALRKTCATLGWL